LGFLTCALRAQVSTTLKKKKSKFNQVTRLLLVFIFIFMEILTCSTLRSQILKIVYLLYLFLRCETNPSILTLRKIKSKTLQ